MDSKKFTCRSMLPSCFRIKPNPGPEPKPGGPSSPHRLTSPEISNLDSEISIHNISSSLTGSNLHMFTLDELRVITNNFSYSGNYIGEGRFGVVYKGIIDGNLRPGVKAQTVAVKVLDLEGHQGHKGWLAEIFLGQLSHPNLVTLIGYCCQNEHRVLIYEYMSRGNLDNQLFERCSVALPWLTRMEIALGAAKGLAFLHEANQTAIFRDFKAANVLLDADFKPKLSDFGFARGASDGDKFEDILETKGYVLPEWVMGGRMSIMSDVYSFGVVLLKLLTGKRSMDKTRPQYEHDVIQWAKPLLNDPRRLSLVTDPRFEGLYSTQGIEMLAMLAYECLSDEPKSRPTMSAVVKTLESVMEMEGISRHFGYFAPNEDDKVDSAAKTKERKQNGTARHVALHKRLNNATKFPKTPCKAVPLIFKILSI